MATLRSSWLTRGPRVERLEAELATAVGGLHAVGVDSCTAALHLAVVALGLKAGQGVLVPTMTFAATAAVVCYQGAIPILVDCDPLTLNMDLDDAERKVAQAKSGTLSKRLPKVLEIVGIIPVHVAGRMMDIKAIQTFAIANDLWIVEDAAHAFPAAWRASEAAAWQHCGQGTGTITCFSFGANNTITTGEGGMAVTEDRSLAQRMRLSLNGLSHDGWQIQSGKINRNSEIIRPRHEYDLTDIAAAIGIHQLSRAELVRRQREGIAHSYLERLADLGEIELPPEDVNRIHARHLFPIRLCLNRLTISRNDFLDELKQAGVECSVHWRPLHLQPYYEETFGWRPEDFPTATTVWERLISLPIFAGMRRDEIDHVIKTIEEICNRRGN